MELPPTQPSSPSSLTAGAPRTSIGHQTRTHARVALPSPRLQAVVRSGFSQSWGPQMLASHPAEPRAACSTDPAQPTGKGPPLTRQITRPRRGSTAGRRGPSHRISLWEAEIGALGTLILGTPPETPVLGQESGTRSGVGREAAPVLPTLDHDCCPWSLPKDASSLCSPQNAPLEETPAARRADRLRCCGMEAPELTCPPSPARDQPTPSTVGDRGGQASSPSLALGPVILPLPELGLAPALFLKALPIPLYHTVPPGAFQPRAPLLSGGLDAGGTVPFILSPLRQPEVSSPGQAGKPGAPTLTVSLMGALPVLSPGVGPALGSPGRVRSASKHVCPHCGRDCGKPSVLEKHIRSHTGERPFPCTSCGIAFKTQSNLYKHRRTQTHLSHSCPTTQPGTEGQVDSWTPSRTEGTPSVTPLSPGPTPIMHLSPAPKILDVKLEAPGDEEGPSPRRKLLEQKSPPVGKPSGPLQSWEKAGDGRASEIRLHKCESTDSGYLSRSDSVEQALAPGSPLHSLSEHSAESEGEGGPPAAPRTGLALEKKQLEERIARLISHNQEVVADAQLEHVRPRRSLLGQQGSLDLPLPYTFKDSFHFELREPRHRPGPAHSALGPPDRMRPLFFHSVPTQLSTHVECVPVTRSNSLPAVEGTRTWSELSSSWDPSPRKHRPLSSWPGPARLGGGSGLTMGTVPSSHPRALVRQTAVEDLHCPSEESEGDRVASRGRGSRKAPSRKPRMFSEEKWQVYGQDTFQRLYQKVDSGHAGGRRAVERNPACGGFSVHVQSGPQASLPAPRTVSVVEAPKLRDTVTTAGGIDRPQGHKAMLLSTLSCQVAPSVTSQSDLPLAAQEVQDSSPALYPLGKVESKREGGLGGVQNPELPNRSLRDAQPVEGVPSETKKLKVQGQSSQETESGPCRDNIQLGQAVSSSSSSSSSSMTLSGTRAEEPPVHHEGALPRRRLQLATLPLADPVDAPFPPKYLLRLPQGEHRARKLDQELPSGKGWLEDPVATVGSERGPLPCSDPVPRCKDGFTEGSGRYRPGGRRKGQLQKKDGRGDPDTSVDGDCPGVEASFSSTPPWNSQGAKDALGEEGKASVGERPRTPGRDQEQPLDKPQGTSSPMLEGRHGPYFCSSGTAGGCRTPFPSLRTEPQLTWCCLHRSLPLARGHQDMGASTYLAPSVAGTRTQAPWVASSRGRSPHITPKGPAQLQGIKFSCPPTSGLNAQSWAPGPDWKDNQPRRRTKRARGNSQQHRLSTTSKRYKGTFWPSRAQLHASRLRKPRLGLKCEQRAPMLPWPGPHRTPARPFCKNKGRAMRGESSLPTPAGVPGGGNEEMLEDGDPQTSGSIQFKPISSIPMSVKCPTGGDIDTLIQVSLWKVTIGTNCCVLLGTPGPPKAGRYPLMSTSSATLVGNFQLFTELMKTDIPLSASELGDRTPKSGSGASLTSHSCMDNTRTLFQGKCLDLGLAEIPQLPFLEQAHQDSPPLHTSPDASKPRFSEPSSSSCEKVGEDHCGRKDGDSGAMVPRGGPASLDSAEPTVIPETPSQTIKRRSVEGMRKQNRVELSDTSSDDEDRLVIEL
ncbi:zinc finger protein 831 [Suncus etruscus]|uniref:zinc finger protein 831 n=1 Tax=Suncus etruscus TaxID=109475 RepID=UPI00210FD6B2|nr:zinc finger protein 831 [Suncus etruscus]